MGTSPAQDYDAGMYDLPGAVTYGRQSLGKDVSIEEQLELGRKRCAAEEWRFLGQYSDRISASRHESRVRDDWERLLRGLSRPEVRIMWLWESSRGDRKLSTWASMLELCRDNHVRIYVETHGRLYDMDNARDWRTLAEDGVDNAYESEKTSTRTKRSAESRASKGRPHAAASYGYVNLHDERTGDFTERAIMEGEAANMRELFTRIKRGHSLRAIERDWKERGIRTRTPEPCKDNCTKPHRNNGGNHVAPGTPGVPFTSAYLRYLALTPAYAGIRVHLTKAQRKADPFSLEGAVDGQWEPIVKKEDFFAVREILTDPSRKVTRAGRAVHLLTVSTAARCDVCDGALSITCHHTGGEWMYFCQQSGHVRVLESELDQIAETAIIEYLSAPENYSAFTKPADSEELARVRGQLAQVRAQQTELATAITKLGKSVAWALAADQEFTQQIAALEAREREITAPGALQGLIEPGKDVARRWRAAPLSARRQVTSIVLSPGRRGVLKVTRGPRGHRVPVAGRVRWENG